jgi:hypothetical protein
MDNRIRPRTPPLQDHEGDLPRPGDPETVELCAGTLLGLLTFAASSAAARYGSEQAGRAIEAVYRRGPVEITLEDAGDLRWPLGLSGHHAGYRTRLLRMPRSRPSMAIPAPVGQPSDGDEVPCY